MLQGQAPTRWLLFSVSLIHQMPPLGNRERLHNTFRELLNKHRNTFYMVCRKQLTLSRVTRNKVQSCQSPVPFHKESPYFLPKCLVTVTLIEQKM